MRLLQKAMALAMKDIRPPQVATMTPIRLKIRRKPQEIVETRGNQAQFDQNRQNTRQHENPRLLAYWHVQLIKTVEFMGEHPRVSLMGLKIFGQLRNI